MAYATTYFLAAPSFSLRALHARTNGPLILVQRSKRIEGTNEPVKPKGVCRKSRRLGVAVNQTALTES